jgi:hypothetical protein
LYKLYKSLPQAEKFRERQQSVFCQQQEQARQSPSYLLSGWRQRWSVIGLAECCELKISFYNQV